MKFDPARLIRPNFFGQLVPRIGYVDVKTRLQVLCQLKAKSEAGSKYLVYCSLTDYN